MRPGAARPALRGLGPAATRPACAALAAAGHSTPFQRDGARDGLTGRPPPHLGRWDWESTTGHGDGSREQMRPRRELRRGARCRPLRRRAQRLAIAALLVQRRRLTCSTRPPRPPRPAPPDPGAGALRRRWRRRRQGVMVLHDINLAARYASHVLLLDGEGGLRLRAGRRDPHRAAPVRRLRPPAAGRADGDRPCSCPPDGWPKP